MTPPSQAFPKCPLIEVCVESDVAGIAAIGAGADRIELNSRLDLDGLTPPIQQCLALKLASNVPVIGMLRPNALSFVYSEAARATIFQQAEELLACGLDGVAFGALTPDGCIDNQLMLRVRKLTEGKQLVMHRAFDALANQEVALKQLIDLGIDRVLTSGGQATAEAGINRIRSLVNLSQGKVEILPGAGINLSNAQRILSETGASQLHGTFRQIKSNPVMPDTNMIQSLKKLRLS